VDEVAAQIAGYIRQLKPQVVLTFDPIGGYRHPDHIAIHQATVRAFDLAGEATFSPNGLPPYQPQKLYYHTFPRGYMKLLVRLMPLFGKNPRKWGRNEDIDLLALASEDFPVHAVINYKDVGKLKVEASACHASQGGAGLSRGLSSWLMRLRAEKDNFMRAYPAPKRGQREKDLFEGINHTI